MNEAWRYQMEKIDEAVRMFMSLTLSVSDRVEAAMREFSVGFGQRPVPAGAENHVQAIREIMGWGGAWRERASALDENQLGKLRDAFHSLHDAITRAYYE